MGYGLAALNRLAGSPILDRLRLRKPAEHVAFQAAKSGFRVAGAASRGFSTAQGLTKPVRQPTAAPRDLFDLTRPLVAAMAAGVSRGALEETRRLLTEAGVDID